MSTWFFTPAVPTRIVTSTAVNGGGGVQGFIINENANIWGFSGRPRTHIALGTNDPVYLKKTGS